MPTPVPYVEQVHNLTTFSDAVSAQQSMSHTYTANIPASWSFTPAAHGGFLVSAVAAIVRLHFATTLKHLEQPDTFSLHYEFLLPLRVGQVQVEIRDLRLGKGTSTIMFTVRQGNGREERGVGFATNCGPRAVRDTITMDLGYTQLPALPPITFSDVLNGTDPNWIRYDTLPGSKLEHGALSSLIFAMLRSGPDASTASPAEKRVTQQWISPRHPDQNWTTDMLGILFDNSGPIPEAFFEDSLHSVPKMAGRAVQNEKDGKSSWDHPAWSVPRFYPTVSMNIEVKRMLPVEGEKWLALRWHTKEVVDGRWDIEIEVWDVKGNLIALGSMLSFLVDPRRSPAASMSKKEQIGKDSKI